MRNCYASFANTFVCQREHGTHLSLVPGTRLKRSFGSFWLSVRSDSSDTWTTMLVHHAVASKSICLWQRKWRNQSEQLRNDDRTLPLNIWCLAVAANRSRRFECLLGFAVHEVKSLCRWSTLHQSGPLRNAQLDSHQEIKLSCVFVGVLGVGQCFLSVLDEVWKVEIAGVAS